MAAREGGFYTRQPGFFSDSRAVAPTRLVCVSPSACPGAGGLLSGLVDDVGVRHPVDLDVQDLTLIPELHDNPRLVTFLVEGN